MKLLQGKWNYQSFCALAADVDRTKVPPEVRRPAQLASPWTPPALMNLKTDSFGKITGKATLGPIEFKIHGVVTPAAERTPEGVDLTVTVKQFGTVYQLRGYFLSGSDHVVGTVVAISNDLGYQPVGTSGPFALYPAA